MTYNVLKDRKTEIKPNQELAVNTKPLSFDIMRISHIHVKACWLHEYVAFAKYRMTAVDETNNVYNYTIIAIDARSMDFILYKNMMF